MNTETRPILKAQLHSTTSSGAVYCMAHMIVKAIVKAESAVQSSLFLLNKEKDDSAGCRLSQ